MLGIFLGGYVYKDCVSCLKHPIMTIMATSTQSVWNKGCKSMQKLKLARSSKLGRKGIVRQAVSLFKIGVHFDVILPKVDPKGSDQYVE